MGLERHGLFGFWEIDFVPGNLVLVGSFNFSSERKMCVMKLFPIVILICDFSRSSYSDFLIFS